MELKKYVKDNHIEIVANLEEVELIYNIIRERVFTLAKEQEETNSQDVERIKAMESVFDLYSDILEIVNYKGRQRIEEAEKKFRTISNDAKLYKKKGKAFHGHKTFRYWYFYGDQDKFKDWFNSRLETIETGNDIIMLACTIRDKYKDNIINKDIAKACFDELVDFENSYELNFTNDIKGLNELRE